MNHDLSYLRTEYARNKMIESYQLEAKEKQNNHAEEITTQQLKGSEGKNGK